MCFIDCEGFLRLFGYGYMVLVVIAPYEALFGFTYKYTLNVKIIHFLFGGLNKMA